MSQAINTFWDERIERVGAPVRVNRIEQKRVRVRRLIDAIILTVVLAAMAICVSVYTRAQSELTAAINKHAAAGQRLEDLRGRVEKLDREVKQLRTDSRVIEQFARQRFGFVRAGDVVIRIAQDPNETGKSDPPREETAKNDPSRSDVADSEAKSKLAKSESPIGDGSKRRVQ